MIKLSSCRTLQRFEKANKKTLKHMKTLYIVFMLVIMQIVLLHQMISGKIIEENKTYINIKIIS